MYKFTMRSSYVLRMRTFASILLRDHVFHSDLRSIVDTDDIFTEFSIEIPGAFADSSKILVATVIAWRGETHYLLHLLPQRGYSFAKV